jgi:glycosyltransferase involved in cell wall biosynthesis
MPCLNEAETLEICIKKANHWIRESNYSCEILIADNGSTDGSQEIAKKNGARVIAVKQKGYGSALFYGSMEAKGDFIIMGDSDDSYDFSNLDLFVKKLNDGFDLVMGNRFLGGIADGAMPWKNRYIGNPILTSIGRLLFQCPSSDFHCGLRGFRKSSFLQMDLRTTGMEFASEMVIKANLFGMKIAEVPTTLSKDGRSRPPHLRPWRDGWRHLRFMFLFSPRWLFIIPGMILLVVSLIIYLFLLTGSIRIGLAEFDIHTLFYAQAGIVLGFSSVGLGLIVRLFGMREGLLNKVDYLESLRTSPALEVGGVAGVTLLGSGMGFALYSLLGWSNANFGQLSSGELLRTVSLSTTLIMVGGILILISLIMGFLSLPTRNQRL